MNDETAAAVAENSATEFIKKFPKVDRNFSDPPINLQQIGLISFIPAKGATPNDKGIYGFAKLRGNYANEDEANIRAEELIRDHDSANIIYHTYVGRPFPLTNSKKYAAETSEVDIRKDTTEAVSSKIKEQKKEDQKIAEEMKDRQQELMDDVSGNRPQDDIDLDEYITLNVKKAQLSWTYLEHVTKLREVRGLILKARQDIVDADEVNPSFRDSFFEKYNSARGKSGLETDVNEDQKQNGFLRYLVEDVTLPGIDEIDELVDGLVELDTVDQKRVTIVPITDAPDDAPTEVSTPSGAPPPSPPTPKKVYEDDM
jgi:hypothetical protein